MIGNAHGATSWLFYKPACLGACAAISLCGRASYKASGCMIGAHVASVFLVTPTSLASCFCDVPLPRHRMYTTAFVPKQNLLVGQVQRVHSLLLPRCASQRPHSRPSLDPATVPVLVLRCRCPPLVRVPIPDFGIPLPCRKPFGTVHLAVTWMDSGSAFNQFLTRYHLGCLVLVSVDEWNWRTAKTPR